MVRMERGWWMAVVVGGRRWVRRRRSDIMVAGGSVVSGVMLVWNGVGEGERDEGLPITINIILVVQ
jgi:hypothetical protein